MDASGSLMHSFRNNMKNVVKTNWYHMLSLAGLKVFLCRLEYQDAEARELAIKAAIAGRFRPLTASQQIVSEEHKELENDMREILSQVAVNNGQDNIAQVRENVKKNRKYVVTRQVSAKENTKILLDHRRLFF